MAAPASNPAAYTLLQFSSDPWNARFEDLENRLAFTVYVPPTPTRPLPSPPSPR